MKYEYVCLETGKVYEVSHSITRDACKTMKEVIELSEGIDNLKLSEDFEQEPKEETDFNEDYVVERIVSGGVGVIFKGLGWPSMDSKHLRYTGKRKKQVEKLREDRAKRVSSGLSVADVAQQTGMDGVKDSIVPNAKWEALSKDQKATARSHGIRPSKEFTK